MDAPRPNADIVVRRRPPPELGLQHPGHTGENRKVSDLRQRVPGHSLIDELLRQWDLGTIRVDPGSRTVVIDEEATGWFRGVLGERRVAETLEPLGEEWTVLHSVPVGHGTSDIDHVVIGPPGVFTINTKYSPGRDVWVGGYGMYVGGHKQHYVTNSIAEAKRASLLLSREARMAVPVVGVIAFVDPGHITVKAVPGGGQYDPEIVVTGSRGLYDALQRRREFSDEQLGVIVGAASRASTWHSRPQPSTIGSHITREFEALEDAVGPHVGAAVPVRRPQPAAGRPVPQTARSHDAQSAARATSSGSNRRRSRRKRHSIAAELLRLAAAGVGLYVFVQVTQAMTSR